MVKRAPTPPPAWDDEPKYFVVYQPYPINANMELPGDRIRCSFWLACILGDPEYLNALYHKPSSQSIVIIEVKRGFTNDRALLGAHRWQEFLRTSQADEKDRASMIYYCSYNTGRHVQKDGWRRKEVEAAWFHASQWRLYNSIVKYPYPSTHGCGLPPQDVIHRSLARPLPVGHFPPPPPTRAPPPGSEAYLEAKKREASTPKKRISVGGPAWSIGSPQANEGPEDRGPLDLWGISPSDSGSSEPSSLGSTSDGRLLATPSPTSSVPIPVAPPGLLTPYGITVDQGPPGLVHPSRQVFISPSIYTDNEEEADSEYLPLSAMVTQMDDMTIMDGGELESHVFEAADMAPPPSTPDEENLWAGYGTEVKDAAADPNEMLCPDHGTTCGKGICQTRAAWKKQLEREQRERERKEGGNRGRGRGRERGGDRGRRARNGNHGTGQAWRKDTGQGSSAAAGSGASNASGANSKSVSKAWTLNDSSGSKAWTANSSASKSAHAQDADRSEVTQPRSKSFSGKSWTTEDAAPAGKSTGSNVGDPEVRRPAPSIGGEPWATDSVVGETPWSIKKTHQTQTYVKPSSREPVESERGDDDRWATQSAPRNTTWDAKSTTSGRWPTESVIGETPWDVKPAARGWSGKSVISDRWAKESAVGETPWDAKSVVSDRWATQSAVGKTPWDVKSVVSDKWATESAVGETPWDVKSVVSDKWATQSAVGETPWDVKSVVSDKWATESAIGPTPWGTTSAAPAAQASWADQVEEEEQKRGGFISTAPKKIGRGRGRGRGGTTRGASARRLW